MGIVKAGNSFLEFKGVSLRAHDLTGSGFEGLEALVDAGYPVLVWTTLYQEEPRFDENIGDWWIDEHCVVMYSCTDSVVRVSDPLRGYAEYDRDSFEHIFDMCGNHALYIR